MSIRKVAFFGLALLAIGLTLGKVVPQAEGPRGVKPSGFSFARLPLGFEATGERHGEAGYLLRGRGYTVSLLPAAAVLTLGGPHDGASSELRLTFEGASPADPLIGEDTLPGVCNYFIGSDPGRWRTGVPTYAKVRARDIYPGVDLVYYGNQQELEFDLVVNPGSDPTGIVLALEGSRKIEIEGDGDLLADLGDREVRLRRPHVYQGSKDNQESVDGSFVVRGRNRVGFEVASYDSRLPLVIDPALVYSTYFGGNNWDVGGTITVDGAGDVYFLGSTRSANIPMSNALYPTFLGGDYDVVVAKLNPAGDTLIFSTYLGGNAWDTAATLTVDSDGDIYIAGVTDSLNFPLVSPLQSQYGGAGTDGFGDSFVTKMKGDGSALLYSTYLGGAGADHSRSIAVDAQKNAYVVGVTESANFPTSNPYQSARRGPWDAFLSKINASGSGFAYSTYFGGSGSDFGGDVTVSGAGVPTIIGNTNSASDFPLANACQASIGEATMDSSRSLTHPASLSSFRPISEGAVMTSHCRWARMRARRSMSPGEPSLPTSQRPIPTREASGAGIATALFRRSQRTDQASVIRPTSVARDMKR